MHAFINSKINFLEINDIFDLNLNEQKWDISKDKMNQALGGSGYETNFTQTHMGIIIGINKSYFNPNQQHVGLY
jgi:hypothetical protein